MPTHFTRKAFASLTLLLSMCIVHAQDFQIGGDTSQSETSVPLEIHPSLGLFVVGYINGNGPYRFGLTMGHTALTVAVIKSLGLQTTEHGVLFDYTQNHTEQNLKLVPLTVRLGDDWTVPVDGASVIPEDNLASYVPVADYGGVLGSEFFRNAIVKLDLSHARMGLLPVTNTFQVPSHPVELPIEQSSVGKEFSLTTSTSMSLDDQAGNFNVTFSNSSIIFSEDSELGKKLFDKSNRRTKVRMWTPNGILHIENSVATLSDIGGREAKGQIAISRYTDQHELPRHSKVLESPIDGSAGLRVLHIFDFVVDAPARKMWLTKRAIPACRPDTHSDFHGTTGFTVWQYQGKGIVHMVIDDSPADIAGISPGDEIISIDGSDVPTFYAHQDATCMTPAPVHLVYKHGSTQHDVTITPDYVPPRAASEAAISS